MDQFLQSQLEKQNKLESKLGGTSVNKRQMVQYTILLAVFLSIAAALYYSKPKFIIREDGQVCPYRVFGISATVTIAVYVYLYKI